MNLVHILILSLYSLICTSCIQQFNCQTKTNDDYQENLFIKPLSDGKLFAQFQFKTTYRKDLRHLRWENKFEIFPLSIADLVAETDLNRLHFSLTKGNWKYREWGYSTRPSPPGAQIRVQFSQHNENPDRSWNRLVNSLAGKFCASLISAGKNSIVKSKLAFSQHPASVQLPQQNSSEYIHVNLPDEGFCTENLTPWRKLLPCYQNLGIASLLNAVKLLESSYSSLSLDLEPGDQRVHLTQSLIVVFNPVQLFEGKQVWSLAKIFGNSIKKSCPVASQSKIVVDTTNLGGRTKLYPQSYIMRDEIHAVFDVYELISKNNEANIGVKQNQLFKRPPASSRPILPVHLSTHVAGSGTDSAIVATITNKYSEPIRVTYMDAVPYFLRVYLHTLTIRTSSGHELKPDTLNFVLSKETTPTLIEFSVVIPPNSDAQISYDFERTFLRWSDYRPDAHKGVLINSAQINFSPHSSDSEYLVMAVDASSDNSTSQNLEAMLHSARRIYARPLLIILPTPDFSMPYNVICLVSTVLVAAFGPLHSMTTTRPVIKVNKKDQKKSEESKKDQ